MTGNQEAAISENQENTNFLKLEKDKQYQVGQILSPLSISGSVLGQIIGKLERDGRYQSTRTSLVIFQTIILVVLKYQTMSCYMKQC